MALVRGAERTLLAHPGAADHFGLADLESSGVLVTLSTSGEGEKKEPIIVYVEGFFAIHSWDVTVRLAEVSYSSARNTLTQSTESEKFRGRNYYEKLYGLYILSKILSDRNRKFNHFNFQVCTEIANCSFAFNLCGEFAFEATPGFASGLFDLLPKVDAIFGNASELRRFAETAVSEGRLGAASLLQGEGEAQRNFKEYTK